MISRFNLLVFLLLFVFSIGEAATVETVGYNDTHSALINKANFDQVLEAEALVSQGKYSGNIIIAPYPYQYMVWFFSAGSRLYANFTVESDMIAVQFSFSDSNDGVAKVYVDGILMASFDSVNQGNWYIQISDLPKIKHNVIIESDKGSNYLNDDLHVDAIAAGTLQCEQSASGLVSWWPGDGNAHDLVDGNDGTLEGGTAFEQGACGEAFRLDGIDDYVDLGNDGSLHLSSGDFTVSAWVKFNALSHPPGSNNGAPAGDMSIVDKMSDSGVNRDGWRLAKQDDNRFWFCLGGRYGNRCWDPAYTVFSQTRANTLDWFHVVAVKSSSGFAIYLNGILEDSRSNVPNFLDTNTADLRIGSYILEGAHLNGLVDEVQVFNSALTSEEIKELYDTGSGCYCKPENTPPVADAGPDQTIECSGPDGTPVTLDGSGSSDPEEDELTYTWTWDGGSAEGTNPTVTLPYGTTTVTLTVSDGEYEDTDKVDITIADTTPPVVSVSVTPDLLWPPNHKYVNVAPSVTVQDACLDTTGVVLVTATSNEPDNGLGDGDTANDIVINADGTISQGSRQGLHD